MRVLLALMVMAMASPVWAQSDAQKIKNIRAYYRTVYSGTQAKYQSIAIQIRQDMEDQRRLTRLRYKVALWAERQFAKEPDFHKHDAWRMRELQRIELLQTKLLAESAARLDRQLAELEEEFDESMAKFR